MFYDSDEEDPWAAVAAGSPPPLTASSNAPPDWVAELQKEFDASDNEPPNLQDEQESPEWQAVWRARDKARINEYIMKLQAENKQQADRINDFCAPSGVASGGLSRRLTGAKTKGCGCGK